MKIRLLLFVLLFSLTSFAGLQRLNLSDALLKHVVKAEGVGKGGYSGQALKLHLTNTSGNQLLITVDPGILFRPEDTMQQDLVLAGGEKVILPPFKDATVEVFTFCAKSYAHAPGTGQAFLFLKKGSDTLVQVLNYLQQKNLLRTTMAQSAIWVVTNGHDLSGVYDAAYPRQQEALIEFLSNLTGRKKPDVFHVYEQRTEEGVAVFNPKVLQIIGSFEAQLDAPLKLSLGVYDEAGTLIQPVFENRIFGKGGHRFKVDFEAKNVAAGNYFIRLSEGERVVQEKKVTVE